MQPSQLLSFLLVYFLGLTSSLPVASEIDLTPERSPSHPFSLLLPRQSSRVRASLAGGQSQIGPGTYPRITRLSDGSLLAVYTAFGGGSQSLQVARSTNNGGSWGGIGSVASGASNAKDIDNAFLLQLPSGRILCAFRDHDRNPANGAYTFFRITVASSDDGGRSWRYLSTPASDAGNGNWEPFLRLATDGSLQLYYAREANGADQDVLLRFSSNGGAGWTSATIVAGAGIGNSRDGMVGVTSLGNPTSLIGVFESYENGAPAVLNAVFSSDDGRSWGGRRRIYASDRAGGANAGAPQVLNVGGTLVVVFMTDEDTGSRNLLRGANVKVITSGDLGGSWGNKAVLGGVQSSWPGVVGVNANTFLTAFDNGGSKAQLVNLS